jgi:hypothetical protein
MAARDRRRHCGDLLLQIFQVGSLNYTALLAIPVLISSALGGLMLAFGTTACITLLTLAYTFWQYHGGLNDGAQSYYQTAFSCAGYFCVAYLTHELAKRVRRERSQALFNRLRTQTQEQVNSLVINHFSDGVLVVDSSLQVLQANPAALQLLGLPIDHPQPFSCRPIAGGSRWRIPHKPALPMPARCPPRFTCRPMNDTVPPACMRTRITEVSALSGRGSAGASQPLALRHVSSRPARDGSAAAHRKAGLHGPHVGRGA